MKKKVFWKKATTTSVAVLLSLAMMTTGVSAAGMSGVDGSSPADSWADRIDEMLADRSYEEGEAVVIYDNRIAPAASGDRQQKIGVASGEAAEETLEGVDVRDKEDAVSVKLVSNKDKTTRELLEELAEDPAVLSAEPNYISEIPQLPAISEQTTGKGAKGLPASEGQKAAMKAQAAGDDPAMDEITLTGERGDFIEKQGYDKVADLSGLQWGYGPADPAGHYSLHSPKWNEKGSANVSAEEDMVVAVVDSGIDHTHPDLAPVMVDMSAYGMDIGGKYGYNSSNTGEATDSKDHNGHGTHCAGIIASAWDGQGTSGVASGVKLCAVRAADNTGNFSYAAIVRAFVYLIKACDKGMNLKSVNCSYGGRGSANAERLLVNELGRRGVVTCYASGNSSLDNDNVLMSSSSQIDSPYALVVNSATPSGQMADYTDFGAYTTHLFSPGDAILSTVCEEAARYLPSIDPGRKAYDTFAGAGDGVQVMYLDTISPGSEKSREYTKDEFLSLVSNWKEAGKRVSESESFDGDGRSYEIQPPKLKDPGRRALYLVSVPVNEEDADAISNFGVSVKSTLSKCRAWVRPVTYSADNIRLKLDGNEGWLRPSDVWCSFDVAMATDGATRYPYYNGRMFFFVMLSDVAATSQNSELYFDCVGGGTDILRYAFFQGTSMATPAVTGTVPVMFERLNGEGALEGLTKQDRAAAVVEAMKASTVYSPAFDGKCSSNGALDLDVTKENYTPLISSIHSGDGNVFKIEGKHFGEEMGQVYYGDDEVEPAKDDSDPASKGILSWSDTEITLRLAGTIVNNRVTVTVVAANKKKTQRSFIYNNDNGRKTYESQIRMDDAIKDCQIESMIASNGKVYLVPRTIQSEYKNPIACEQLWSYDLASDRWTKLKDIPEPEIIHEEDRSAWVELNTFGKYIVAHVGYIAAGKKEKDLPQNIPNYADRVYLYNPDIDTWTEVDLSQVEPPFWGKAFGTDAGLFLTGGACPKKDEGSEPASNELEDNRNIYALEFDAAPVEEGAESVMVTGLRDAGVAIEDENVPVSSCARIQTIGDSTIILADQTIWLKWSDKSQKFTSEAHADVSNLEGYGKENGTVLVSSELTCGANTPLGAVFAGVPGNNYTGRGFDTFFLNTDGSIDAYDRYASFADLYDSLACYTDGSLIVWGNTYYNKDKTLGYMARTELVKEVNPQVTLSQYDYIYDGTVKTPDVTVKADEQILKNGRDYDVTYDEGRQKAGSYKVNVTLKGSYSGSASATFTIEKAKNSIRSIKPSSKTLKAKSLKKKAQTFRITAKDQFGAKMTFAMDKKKTSNKAKKYVKVSKAGKVTVKKGTPKGTYAVKTRVCTAPSSNYYAAEATKTIRIRVK